MWPHESMDKPAKEQRYTSWEYLTICQYPLQQSNSWKGTETDESHAGGMYQQLNILVLSTMIPCPTIISIWSQEQAWLLAQSKAQSTSLSIGGDGRADSPGHSAKYGSYGIIDLNTYKVLHIELVQV